MADGHPASMKARPWKSHAMAAAPNHAQHRPRRPSALLCSMAFQPSSCRRMQVSEHTLNSQLFEEKHCTPKSLDEKPPSVFVLIPLEAYKHQCYLLAEQPARDLPAHASVCSRRAARSPAPPSVPLQSPFSPFQGGFATAFFVHAIASKIKDYLFNLPLLFSFPI